VISTRDPDLMTEPERRREIATLHRRLDATTLYVTHDQAEAMTLADRLVVMHEGKVYIHQHHNQGEHGGKTIAIEARTGKLLKVYNQGIDLSLTPEQIKADRKVFRENIKIADDLQLRLDDGVLVQSTKYEVVALDAATGKRLWDAKPEGEATYAYPTIGDGMLFIHEGPYLVKNSSYTHWPTVIPEHLRAKGYYCTNNSKKDYQFNDPVMVWDESSGKAHWKNRAEGQPFFAVFNHTGTHESRGFPKRNEGQGDLKPEDAPVPPIYPDTPAVRDAMARTYNNIARMDQWVGKMMKELEEAGELDNTVVIFWSDHGVGLPRGKRSCYDTGLRVPVIVRHPERGQLGKRARMIYETRPDGSARTATYFDISPGYGRWPAGFRSSPGEGLVTMQWQRSEP